MRKKILITGGSGFLGTNLAIKLKTKYKVYLGSRNNHLNNIASNDTGCESFPLDITNIESLRNIISSIKPNIIIHAAATKYVQLSEKHPLETVDININGSFNVLRVANEMNVETLIGVSTDKTAPPVLNIYGLSKSIMERIFCSNKNNKTNVACVRFGNIAWSTGSVFNIWTDMVKKNNLILSTGPHMRRYFFNVDEASDLVITAVNKIKTINGKILVKDMKSAQIKDILEVWCNKYNCKWKKTNERIGDKIDEYLIGESELKHTRKILINNEKYYIIDFSKNNLTDLKLPISSKTSKKLSKSEIIKLIKNEK